MGLKSKQINTIQEESSGIGVVYALIVLVGDGMQPIIRHAVPQDANNLLFTWIASLFEFLILIPVTLILQRHQNRKTIRKNDPKRPSVDITEKNFTKKQIMIRLIIIGFIFAVCSYFLLYGLNLVDSITGIIAIKTQPISMIIIGFFMLKERVDYKEVICSISLIIGAIYVASDGTMNLSNISGAVVILLIVPVFWNIGHALAKPLIRTGTLSVSKLVLGRIGFVTLFLTLFYLLFEQGDDFEQILNMDYLSPMLLMGLLWLMLHLCWYGGVKRLKLSVVASIVVPTPLVTALLSYIFENEQLYYYHFIGIIVEIAALYGLVYLQKKEKSKNKT